MVHPHFLDVAAFPPGNPARFCRLRHAFIAVGIRCFRRRTKPKSIPMKATDHIANGPLGPIARGLAVLCALCASAGGGIVTLLDCPGPVTGSGDFMSRAFYVSPYPGTSINGVTVYVHIPSGSYAYQIALDAHQGTFNGPVIASGYANATLNSTEKAVSIQMVTGEVSNPPVAPGSTVCFTFNVNKQTGAPDPYFSVVGDIGVDLPDGTDPCPGLVETDDSTPPLSTFRREGVKIQITGNKFLNVNPGQSIQLAIDHASPGDDVKVAPGAYTENLTLRSSVNVIGAGSGKVTLNGTGTGDVVTATNVTNTEFSGFTVRNSGAGGNDAGFEISGGSPFIRDNIIQENTSGVRILNSSTAFLCGNIIRNNGNSGNSYVDWGIIVLSGSSPLISNNIVTGNEVGIYLFPASTSGTRIVNNTVAANASDGIWCNDSAPDIRNNIVTGNSPGISGLGSGAHPALTYNDVWGNNGFGNYNAQSGATIVAGTGSISADPKLDAAYHLLASSTCIDAGDPSAIYNDLDGSRNDIGATGGPCGAGTPAGSVVDGFLWTSVGTIAVADIDQTTGAKGGLTMDRDRPFGGSPWLFGPFGSDETAVYRYAIKVGKWTGSTPPAAGSFNYVDDPLSKVRYLVSGGTITTSNVALGPVTFAGVPAYTPTFNGGGTYWAQENLRVVLNTLSLAKGRYSVRLEAYDFFGSLVSLNPNHDLILTVNNTWPVVSIDQISAGGPVIGECAFIELPTPTTPLSFIYTASQADGFLDDYSLVVEVGKNRAGGTIVSDNYANHVSASGVWNGAATVAVTATPANPAPPLPGLQPWERCSYQFRVTAWARTTNGFGRLYWTTFFDNHAIDLGGGGPAGDFDHDGDVDAQDLAIFATNFGTPAP